MTQTHNTAINITIVMNLRIFFRDINDRSHKTFHVYVPIHLIPMLYTELPHGWCGVPEAASKSE